MITRLESLSFSMQANPGLYALLLGSGVSRAAQIPTGWEITCDLTRKLAKLREAPPETDPEDWYRRTFDKPPDYSDLLETLYKKPPERQQALKKYFEPNDRDEEGVKQLTKAHRAIAWLARKGFVKVIVTTNFDPLVESALTNVGVKPTVLSSVDQLQGALPLAQIVQSGCCVLKVHGDYSDPRIRNTEQELAKYPPEINQFLDRILDEFGLVVCGWSAEWDEALRNAIYRAKSRRFSVYWAVHGTLSNDARKLIQHREAQQIPIDHADSFFDKLKEQVQSLDESSRPHPLSTQTAIGSLKRYLAERHYHIRLTDLLDEVMNQAVVAMSGAPFQTDLGSDPDKAYQRVVSCWRACSTLLEMAPIGGYYAEDWHGAAWSRALVGLAHRTPGTWNLPRLPIWQRLPALLLLYSLGIGAVAGDKWRFLGTLFNSTIRRWDGIDYRAVAYLHPEFLRPKQNHVLAADLRQPESTQRHWWKDSGKWLKGAHGPVSISEWLREKTSQHTGGIIVDQQRHNYLFDKLEILLEISYEHHPPEGITPFSFWALADNSENTRQAVQEIEDSVAELADSGIASDSTQHWNESMKRINEWHSF